MIATAIPEIKTVGRLNITEPEVHKLDNGIQVYGFNGAPNEILKLDLIFDAGRWAEKYPLTAIGCASLIKSGSQNESAYHLEEQIDYLGSTIKASSGYNTTTLSIYCMTKYLEPCLRIFVRILGECVYPESEVNLHKLNALSRLKVNRTKNDYVGDMAFKSLLFGEDHPYGYQTNSEKIHAIDGEGLKDFYRSRLHTGNCFIGLAGHYSSSDIDLLNKYLGQNENWTSKEASTQQAGPNITSSPELKYTESLKDSVQASIYIGNLSIPRLDRDYHALSMVNLIYGGYFGSRLMSNIREDKGLTYGIYSYIQQYKHASAFIINTDTAIEYIDQCLHEIYVEMDRLKQQLISDQEMTKARNYLMGRMLDQVDGPFKSAGTFLSLKSHGLPLSFVTDTETAIGELNSEDLMKAAQKYFDREVMYEVVIR